MSIIHDALKKTGDAIQHPQQDAPGTPSPEVASVLKKKRRAKRMKWVIFYFLAAILGLYVGNIPFDLIGKAKGLMQTQAQTPQKKEASPAPKNIPLLKSEERDSDALVLNGIFFSEKDPHALINNQIVRTGEIIKEAIVREINKEEVILESEGRVFKLSTR